MFIKYATENIICFYNESYFRLGTLTANGEMSLVLNESMECESKGIIICVWVSKEVFNF